MTGTTLKIEAFFESSEHWKAELAALRKVLRASPLNETFKWRGPCYTFGDGNVATLWGFREACTLGFFKGVLLDDPEGLLQPPGDNSRSVRVLRFVAVDEIEAARPQIEGFIAQAIAVETSGRKVDFPKDDLPRPDELQRILDADADLAAAFSALTPGRRRGYLLHFAGAKQSATRTARIMKAAPRIRAGKGLQDR